MMMWWWSSSPTSSSGDPPAKLRRGGVVEHLGVSSQTREREKRERERSRMREGGRAGAQLSFGQRASPADSRRRVQVQRVSWAPRGEGTANAEMLEKGELEHSCCPALNIPHALPGFLGLGSVVFPFSKANKTDDMSALHNAYVYQVLCLPFAPQVPCLNMSDQ
nr:unnamed protein product [Digitaria exilis]